MLVCTMDRSDIDRVEDNLRSNLESLRGTIDRIKDNQTDELVRIATLETRRISIDDTIKNHDNTISKLYSIIIGILIAIIAVLAASIGGIC